MTIAYVNWPPSESDPYTDVAGGKRSRLRLLIQTVLGEHPVRPLFGVPLPDAFFNQVVEAQVAAMRQAIRDAVNRYEPWAIISPGLDGVALVVEVVDNQEVRTLSITYRDADEPDVIQDPLNVRLRSG
jgi:phage baseplate assembly protein W